MVLLDGGSGWGRGEGRGGALGPCGRQAASVIASAICFASLHVSFAGLILCDSVGNIGGILAASDLVSQVTETGQA